MLASSKDMAICHQQIVPFLAAIIQTGVISLLPSSAQLLSADGTPEGLVA